MHKLGSHSKSQLRGVHPDLVAVVSAAIRSTSQDFTVFDGLRTLEEQHELVRRGASHLMKSKHLQQDDGWGHAVDLVPYIAGRPRWELEACYAIAVAMCRASSEFRVDIRWGGCWDVLRPGASPEQLVQAYIDERRQQGRRPFVDAVHYELA